MKSDIINKLSDLKLFLFDLEGCIISKNNKNNEEEILKKLINYCNEFKSLEKDFAIITASTSKLVEKLILEKPCLILNGTINKVELAEKLIKEKGLTFDDVFYLGDDLLDIPLLQKCKISASPKDGRREVKRIVSFVTKNESGFVVEEILEYIKKSKI